jgi:predicted AAA+ superfamily ATPase
VFIDEIQKLPALMDLLQFLLDEKRITLIASGSSTRKLRRGAANWLPGRIRLERLHPLTWRESGLLDGPSPAALEERLLFGGLPGILSESDRLQRAESLRSYTSLYLEEEIRQEAAVRRLPPFARFLQLAALESGTSPNYSKLGAAVGVSHTSIREYFQILEDSLVSHRLPPFGSGRAALLRKSRHYFFDLGVRNSAAGLGHDPGLLPLQAGTLLEHLVLLETLAAGPADARLSYWRTQAGQEVDLVLERAGKVTAIEVKSTASPRQEDFAGLAAFKKLERCDACFLVCRVERPQKHAHGLALPWSRLASVWE